MSAIIAAMRSGREPRLVGMNERSARARRILTDNRFMTLATADREGRPWASPVWFATADNRDFFWVSSPDARHSRNIAERPEVGIVVFDSTQTPGDGLAVYLSAMAELVPDEGLDRAVAIFSEVSAQQGLSVWPRERVTVPARHRMYRATATEHFVLKEDVDERVSVDIGEEEGRLRAG
jgi:nitroimidazol reductase NimA-like FMN-containing flavoprotein (pyridoxamine 5'-phosphate oxidase superfamily)